jgi:hypothetical protein
VLSGRLRKLHELGDIEEDNGLDARLMTERTRIREGPVEDVAPPSSLAHLFPLLIVGVVDQLRVIILGPRESRHDDVDLLLHIERLDHAPLLDLPLVVTRRDERGREEPVVFDVVCDVAKRAEEADRGRVGPRDVAPGAEGVERELRQRGLGPQKLGELSRDLRHGAPRPEAEMNPLLRGADPSDQIEDHLGSRGGDELQGAASARRNDAESPLREPVPLRHRLPRRVVGGRDHPEEPAPAGFTDEGIDVLAREPRLQAPLLTDRSGYSRWGCGLSFRAEEPLTDFHHERVFDASIVHWDPLPCVVKSGHSMALNSGHCDALLHSRHNN